MIFNYTLDIWGIITLTRILFILFQQASADTMPVAIGAPPLWHWVGWGSGSPGDGALQTLYGMQQELSERSVLMSCLAPSCSPWGFFISAGWYSRISGFSGTRLGQRGGKKEMQTIHCSLLCRFLSLFLSTSQSHIGFKSPSRRNRENVPIPSCLISHIF